MNERLRENLPVLPIERGINPKNGRDSLVINLNNISDGQYTNHLGVIGVQIQNDGQEVVLDCHDCHLLLGKRSRRTRTIQIGADGRGSQQISSDMDLVVDLGQRLKPMYQMIPRQVPLSTPLRWTPRTKKVWEHGREIWTR